jgi:hypothetical protein
MLVAGLPAVQLEPAQMARGERARRGAGAEVVEEAQQAAKHFPPATQRSPSLCWKSMKGAAAGVETSMGRVSSP